jgi:hypothetical protein
MQKYSKKKNSLKKNSTHKTKNYSVQFLINYNKQNLSFLKRAPRFLPILKVLRNGEIQIDGRIDETDKVERKKTLQRKVVSDQKKSVWNPAKEKNALDESASLLRGYLNKITGETYHVLAKQIYELFTKVGHSQKITQKLTEVIYQKARLESEFCYLYAQLCYEISNVAPKFRDCLLKFWTEKFKEFTTDANEDAKNSGSGCVRFMVHLCLRHLVHMSKLEKCAEILIKNITAKKNCVFIEVLCNGLFKTLLEIVLGKIKYPKNFAILTQTKCAAKKFCSKYKVELLKLGKLEGISSRYKFMVMDVTDLIK